MNIIQIFGYWSGPGVPSDPDLDAYSMQEACRFRSMLSYLSIPPTWRLTGGLEFHEGVLLRLQKPGTRQSSWVTSVPCPDPCHVPYSSPSSNLISSAQNHTEPMLLRIHNASTFEACSSVPESFEHVPLIITLWIRGPALVDEKKEVPFHRVWINWTSVA